MILLAIWGKEQRYWYCITISHNNMTVKVWQRVTCLIEDKDDFYYIITGLCIENCECNTNVNSLVI